MGDEFGFILDTLNFRWKIWGGGGVNHIFAHLEHFFENSKVF